MEPEKIEIVNENMYIEAGTLGIIDVSYLYPMHNIVDVTKNAPAILVDEFRTSII